MQCGDYWVLWGALYNIIILVVSTDITEKNMQKTYKNERLDQFMDYKRRTSKFFLWFPKSKVVDSGN